MKSDDVLGMAPGDVIAAVAKLCGYTVAEITNHDRSTRIERARFLCYYACRKLSVASYPELGRIFSRDRTTVKAGVERVEKNPEWRTFGDELVAQVLCPRRLPGYPQATPRNSATCSPSVPQGKKRIIRASHDQGND